MMEIVAAVAGVLIVCSLLVRADRKKAANVDEATLEARRRANVLKLVNQAYEHDRIHEWR